MKIRLSSKDKNLVAMCWLAEIVLSSLVKCSENSIDKIPKSKIPFYDYVSRTFQEAHENVIKLNDQFSEQISKVFEPGFEDTLCDLTLAVVTLYETMRPEQLLKVMQVAGIRDKDIIETYEKSGKHKKSDSS
jgi:hypothetical protein